MFNLNTGTPELLPILNILKFEKKVPFYYVIVPKNSWMCGSRVDPDQTPHSAASDLGLHYLLKS